MTDRLSEARIEDIGASIELETWDQILESVGREGIRALLSELSALRSEQDEARQQRDAARDDRDAHQRCAIRQLEQIATLTAEIAEARQLQGFLQRVDEVVAAEQRAEVAESALKALQGACEQLPRYATATSSGISTPPSMPMKVQMWPAPFGPWIRLEAVLALLTTPPVPSGPTT